MDGPTLAANTRDAIARCRTNVQRFLELPHDVPFGDVVRDFDHVMAPLNGVGGLVGVLLHMHPDAELRRTAEELEQEIAALGTELSLHRGLFERISRLDARRARTPEERRLLEHALRDFRRSGVDRDEATRARVSALREELVQIGQEFDRNIALGGRQVVVEDGHAGLAGLPADFLASHPEREDGSVVLSTDPADRFLVLAYAERDDVRRAYFCANANRAVPENLSVLPRLLAKRHELATLLGYASWADYVTEDKMTGSAATARAFVERVVDLVRERALVEYEELLAEKRRRHPEADFVSESERAHLVERVKKVRFGFDSQSVRPYLPYERVKQGVLGTSAALYGVDFRLDREAWVWHESVECFDVVDAGRVVARFYLDMHPRDGKYKHGAMFHLAEGLEGEALPQAVLACNFPEPRDGDPGLMLHDEVTTFFHEFGHLLHHLFAGRQRFLCFSGISTEHDFVEVPSQMYEEWAWSPDVLATFARHHETGEPIPAELVETLRAADEYGKGQHILLQMYYAMLSMTYYDADRSDSDVGEIMRALKAELLPTRPEEDNNLHASFGHLNGYSAMYYTYMWSLVIAKDLFSRFESHPMDTATAADYRAKVLAPGGSRDARDLVRDFLGREYRFDAFERWLAR